MPRHHFSTLAMLLLTACCAPLSRAAPVPPAWAISHTIAIGGEARWDLMWIDSAAQRLYVSHGSQTEVIDTRSNQLLGTISPTPGVHGVTVASELGLGFTSNGKDNSVTVFDLTTLKTRSTIKVGQNPDAIVYDPVSQRVICLNGRSQDASIIDPRRGVVVAAVALGGKPELVEADGKGRVWLNLENTAELVLLDPLTAKILARHSLKPCENPTGLAIDKAQRLYSVCENNKMIITSATGQRLGEAPIGAGSDGVVWLDGYAMSANGADGTLSVVEQSDKGTFETVATLPTERGARTIVADPATHRLYLPTAQFKPAKDSGRAQGVPDPFHILVLERR